MAKIKLRVNEIYQPVFTTKARYIILMGGRGAGRSTFASQYANIKLMAKEYFRCAIMRYVLGDIRNSIYKEIVDRIEESEAEESIHINDTRMEIDYGSNNINAVGFKKSSGEQKAKLKSLANFNHVIVEEAEEISEPDFIQLDDTLRTVKADIKIILLLNPPPKSHWIIKRWFDLKKSLVPGFFIPTLKTDIDDTLFIHTSYHDNIRNMDAKTVERYERYELTKPDHYYNMICGLVPEVVKGRIYSWEEIDVIPKEARAIGRWLDHGYSVDPTAGGTMYKWGDVLIVDEAIYQTNLRVSEVAALLNVMEYQGIVVADSADQGRNDELRLAGVPVVDARKGPGSIENGIDNLKSKKVFYTKRSVNIKKEQENYRWRENKEGESLGEPLDAFNHHMDGIRYLNDALTAAVSDETVAKQNSRMSQTQERQSMNSTR